MAERRQTLEILPSISTLFLRSPQISAFENRTIFNPPPPAMNPRARYPPGIGNGRGANPNANPNFQMRNPQQPQPQQQQQYVQVQRNMMQQQYQQQQQQQWMRRNSQMGGDPAATEVDKAVVPPEGADSRGGILQNRDSNTSKGGKMNASFLEMTSGEVRDHVGRQEILPEFPYTNKK
ncbi:hypothetical protein ACLOJK_015611 [Asimina triloba]